MTAPPRTDLHQVALLRTKLHAPPPRPNLVSRPRLIQRLDEGLLPGHRLMLVSAPAGFGKTTLLSEWIGMRRQGDKETRGQGEASLDPPATSALPPAVSTSPGPPLAFAWLSLDDEDNDPTRFVAYLIAALETAVPEIGADARRLLQSTPPSSPEAVLTALINRLVTLSNDLVLVLDDYYRIEHPAIHDALAFLLDHVPPQVHVVIASRADPPLPVARLRTRSQLTELRVADLRFTPDEAAAFLNQAMGLGLSPDDVAALEARTEGWIAGLQLAALSVRGRATERVADFITAFSGSHRHVIDYLVEEVMSQQPAHIHDFLCQTSILDRMTASLCDAVTGKATSQRVGGSASQRIGDWGAGSSEGRDTSFPEGDSQAILEHLERTNLFVVPLDDRRQWYRYHHLFADFLRARLQKTQPDQLPALHSRASRWYEEQARSRGDDGLIVPAIDHALSAEEFNRAAGLIEQAAEPTLKRSEVATLLRWLETLPEDILRTRPLLCIHYAWLQVLDGRPVSAAMSRLQMAVEADSGGSASAELILFRALMAAYRGDNRRSTELAQEAIDLLPEESPFLRSIVAGFLGFSTLLGSDVAAARQMLTDAARISQDAGNLMITVLALCHLAEVAIIQGQLHEAREFYRQALESAVDGQGNRQPIAGMALMGLGNLMREWNDLEGATRRLEEGIELVDRWAKVGAISGYITLARVTQAQGDAPRARQVIHKARELAVSFDAMDVDDILVGAYGARLSAMQGHLEAAAHWARERGLDGDSSLENLAEETAKATLPYHRALEYLILAQLYNAQGRPDDALYILDLLVQAGDASGWTGFVIEALAAKALALNAQRHTPQALAVLERALSLAAPENYARLFIDEGEPMRSLIADFRLQIGKQARGTDGVQAKLRQYADRLLAAWQEETKDDRRKTKPPPSSYDLGPSSLVEPLSDRELEVLGLIAAGLSNREIAERLVVALSTVKTHINNLYRKLGVSSRTQALARARMLDLV